MPSDIAFYVRNTLQDVKVNRPSLIDRLVESVGDSFVCAAVACRFVRSAPGVSPDDRLKRVLCFPVGSSTISEQIFQHTLENLHVEILAHLKVEPTLAALVTADGNWTRLCQLNALIAAICIRIINESSPPNAQIKDLTVASLRNTEVDLDKFLQNASDLPPALVYACRHWQYHDSFAPPDHKLIGRGESYRYYNYIFPQMI